MSRLYTACVRPLLFALPPETSHHAARLSLASPFPWNVGSALRGGPDPRLRSRIGGLELACPVGLAAGFDKNAQALPGLDHLGFGYLTVGSLMPEPRPGNPRPRLIRYPERESLLNCYGLPSQGLDACLPRLRRFHGRPRRTPLVANIDAPDIDRYLRSFDAVEPHVDAVELGMQCPNNTDDHGEFHAVSRFEALLRAVLQRRRKPVFVKILSYQDEAQRQNRLELAEVAARLGVDAITIPGTWRQAEPALSLGYGHSSGHMAFSKTLETIRDLYSITRGRIAIKANGGIFTGAEAFQALACGADAIEILTALVYRGWDVATLINRELRALLDEHKLPGVDRIRAYAA